ncbi:MAG: lipopolysaccharide heptosyltransferase II [Candidatus Zapsychrus exili]|nr:lipopolysaccharide heptosyltransferase II [Candidatus Zapsychrus exili]
MKKILIINIFGIGDVLFTIPLIRNLKQDYKDCSIGYLSNRRTEFVLNSNPFVDKVFVYERDEFYQFSKESKILYFKKFFELIGNIRQEKYDVVIDVSLNRLMSFVAFLAGIPKRIGFNYKNRSIFLNKKIKLEGYEGKHIVEYYLELLCEIGVSTEKKELKLNISKEDDAWSKDFFNKNGIEGKNTIALVPGGGASWGKDARYKCLPAEKYAKLADKIIENYSLDIILLGDASEHELCMKIAHLMDKKPILVAGKTTIGQFAALVSKCRCVVLNDGGPLHISVAAGAKTISVFGPVDENVYGPFPSDGHIVVKASVVCRPCYRKFRRSSCEHISCLNNITVEDLFRKVQSFL